MKWSAVTPALVTSLCHPASRARLAIVAFYLALANGIGEGRSFGGCKSLTPEVKYHDTALQKCHHESGKYYPPTDVIKILPIILRQELQFELQLLYKYQHLPPPFPASR